MDENVFFFLSNESMKQVRSDSKRVCTRQAYKLESMNFIDTVFMVQLYENKQKGICIFISMMFVYLEIMEENTSDVIVHHSLTNEKINYIFTSSPI
jgi:hypothetical protein